MFLEITLSLLNGTRLWNEADEEVFQQLVLIPFVGRFVLSTFLLAWECPDIRVTEKGLSVRCFVLPFVWKFVPWEAIEDIVLSHRLDRWGEPVWVVQVRKLTLWHRLLGWFWWVGWKPVIVLTSDFVDRDELLGIIGEYVGSS